MNRNTNISDEELETIERYVLNELSPDEHLAYTSRLSNDAELQSKVNELKLLLLGVNETILHRKLNDFHNELPARDTKNTTGKVSFIRRWIVAASAILFIAAGAWLFFSRMNEDEKIFTEYYKPDPGLISAMSTSDNYLFDRGMIDYKTGNYDSAINAWEGLLKGNPGNDTLNYFAASAYLALNKSDQAIQHFNKVITVTDSYFLKDAYWYLGLSLLKEGRKNEAISFIEKADHPHKDDLLLRLKE